MKETGLTGKRRSTTVAATPDDGKSRGKEEEELNIMVDDIKHHIIGTRRVPV